MTSSEIRTEFLKFFESKGHKLVSSAPLVIKNDPTLMFTNAGMNQFKEIFLGNSKPASKRVADTQKCLRVSGKHNDLEEVGFDSYHHTFFEMLGNWSFGDYFKKEAIDYAYQLLTHHYKLPADRLYATVFGGEKSSGLQFDNESFTFWKNYLPPAHIIEGSIKDNFWEMGETGPCGPCSEIHIDLRNEAEREKIHGENLVNKGNPLVIELWNLVFIEFNRQTDGTLTKLPEKHVDTGMGFERLVMALQKKYSNYETDIFQTLIAETEKLSGIKYGTGSHTDIAYRVIADHIRAVSFAIADGQIPSNIKAGYVIRRILRRAVRFGYTFLNFKDAFLYQLIPALANQFKDVFPEISVQIAFIEKVIREEENSFLKTLELGLKKLDETMNITSASKIINGETAFELYDTYGFPLDLTQLISREKGFKVDENGFIKEMEKQKERSRQKGKMDTGDWIIINNRDQSSFVGYEQLENPAHILQYRKINIKGKEFYQIVINKTPFFAESGGQVGDTGEFIFDNQTIKVLDTKKENNLWIHYTEELPVDTSVEFITRVDKNKRRDTENNHSATHILHAVLREVLGKHVVQRGSLVCPEYLRFDFSHFSKIEPNELNTIEKLINEKIRQNIPLIEEINIPLKEALTRGAMALFGEKYAEVVRVITFDRNFSVELCGGTHVNALGNIGLLKIISESSISSGVRRIEAVTAEGAENFIHNQLMRLQKVNELMKQPSDTLSTLENIINDYHILKNLFTKQKDKEVSELAKKLFEKKKILNDFYIISEIIPESIDISLKDLVFKILELQKEKIFIVLGSSVNGKVNLFVSISEDLVKEKAMDASKMIKEFAQDIDGGGGGKPHFASAGGTRVEGLKVVMEKVQNILNEKLEK